MRIKRALVSVYDKTGVVEFARALVEEFGIEVISTGGTAKLLKESGVAVTLVEEITGFPEMLDGRVKTLHPRIHAAILADRDNPDHMGELAEQGIEPIDLVVVNLYPFEKTVADSSCTFEQAIEMIDIGGPGLLRAAAKNHRHVLVVPDAKFFPIALKGIREENISDEIRLRGAFSAFQKTCAYDRAIADWLSSYTAGEAEAVKLVRLCKIAGLRYGENPHQVGDLFGRAIGPHDEARLVGGTSTCEAGPEMSFNNYVDGAAALELCKELTRATVRATIHFAQTESADTGGDVTADVGPTFQSVAPRIKEELHTERHLPHIQNPGSHYFLTFRVKSGKLHADERQIVLEACKYWHGDKMTLHACVVMPDHVHLLLTPHAVSREQWVSLGEITRSIKGYSARQINQRRGRRGSVWLDESWDRIVRNEKEYGERWNYIENNPLKAGLGTAYPWLWLNREAWADLAAHYDRLESRSHNQGIPAESAHRRIQTLHAKFRFTKGATEPLRRRVCVFIKHTNACGVGVSNDQAEAYRRAYLGDPNAAMGGILACNFSVEPDFAAVVMETYRRWGKLCAAGGFFVEVWIAPEFAKGAVEFIRESKAWGQRVRLLSVGDMDAPPDAEALEYKSITGGMLVQSRDLVGLDETQWKVVSKREPTESEMADLRLAWLVCKHTKSNAISICKEGMLIGNGAGQMSRVMNCRIATWLASENGHGDKLGGAAAASDAFFPFSDGPTVLMDAGVTALIQPGGSKRDADTIKACDERDVAMIFTGTRHFKH